MAFESKYMSVEQCLRKLSGLDKEVLLFDHNYVKAWNAHPDSNRTKPARLLFMKGLQRYPLLSDSSNLDEDVDIESFDEPLISPFDNTKARLSSVECERNLKYAPMFFRETVPEDELDVNTFTSRQRKLYQQVLKVLSSDRLAQLSSSMTVNEPIKRRLALDKTSRQIRQLFGLIFWDMGLLSWLHKTLLNHSDISLLSTYIDVLQTLKAKIPTLIDRILQSYSGTPLGDAVCQMVKKPWDPVIPILNQNKPKKLPGNPIILMCPSSPNQHIVSAHSPRLRFWNNYMSSMCKVMNVSGIAENGENPTSAEECLEQMMASIRSKVSELKNHYPNRPLILLGWTIGALIACHIALQEPVDGVICLGFPLTGVNGSRGDLNDPLLDNKVPTLFIVGQNAHMCSTDDIEDFRSRMRAETALVVVGGADDMLRMCPMKLKLECVTQAIVDRCLLDEIGDFLMSVVVKIPSTSVGSSVAPKPCTPIKEEETEAADEEWKPEEEGKRRRRKPREYSPELLSPVRKRPRHHIARQAPALKTRLSPSSSETSSSGSGMHEKTVSITKPVKKSPEKRIGRPTAGTWRKRTPGKPITNMLENISKNIARMEEEELESPLKTLSDPKSSLPFSKNILPKKNDPVDVEKAFGKDSSFLPRPLTPPEPEDTVSAEETEKAMAELEAMAELFPGEPPLISSINPSGSSLSTSERSFLPISDIENKSKVVSSQPSPVAVSTPTVSSVADSKPTVALSLPSSLQEVFSQAKASVSSVTSLQTFKSVGGISLLTNSQASMSNPSKSTIITVPSASAATLLVSSPAMRAQPAKMIHLLTKGGSTLTTKGTVTMQQMIASSSGISKEPSNPTSCNLSLLSDVAGMTEPMKDGKKPEGGTSSATLVKLASSSSDRGPFSGMKCVKVIKTVRAPSPPTRVETAEEMVEKQLAIQALNKSIGIESGSNLIKESGYSICYAKADGSIVSRSVTRPNYGEYVANPTGPSRGRGRGRPAFSSKLPYKMYEM